MRDPNGNNAADQLDGEILGEKPGDDHLPGIEDYPPERPLGVEDPRLLQGGAETRDDLITRQWRHAESLLL